MQYVRLENNPGAWIWAHSDNACLGPACPIHRRTDHPMRSWPQHWRDDRALMERLCPDHGVGHPDPDHLIAYAARHTGEDTYGESVHGCCGCCSVAARTDIATVTWGTTTNEVEYEQPTWADRARPTPDVPPPSNCPGTPHRDHTKAGTLCPLDTPETPMDETTGPPTAWRDLLEALNILARHPGSDISPFHCEHDELTVMADPADFTAEEIAHLDDLGFHAGRPGSESEGTFYSYRFGSA